MEKRQSLHYVVLGKLNSCLYENGCRTVPNAIHGNKLKMEKRPKCEGRHYKTLRGKYRQNTLT